MSSSPLSYILCKLGVDAVFQLVLCSRIQRDTHRLGLAVLTTVGDEEHGGKVPSAGALILPARLSLSVLWRMIR